MNNPLPPILAEKFGHLPGIKQRTAKEWSSACPNCGDSGHVGSDEPDRFRMFNDEKPLGWCRRCQYIQYALDETSDTPDTARLLELDEIRQYKAKQEAERLQARIEELQRAAYWEGYHDAMTDTHRGLWRQAGIPDEFQDYWRLGFTRYKAFGLESPALTIPYFGQEWKAQTIQYRLTNPQRPSDKYRFESGLKMDIWRAEPDREPKNAVLLCEGMKKAAVVFVQAVATGLLDMAVTAVPSKMPGKDLLQVLANADPLYICLDPDAHEKTVTPDGKWMKPAVSRLASLIDVPKRIVKLPCKADDFFILHAGTPKDFASYLNLARPI